MATLQRSPTPLASGLALLAAAIAAFLLATEFTRQLAVVGALVGMWLVVAGGRDPAGSTFGGGLLTAIGGVVTAGAVLYGTTTLDAPVTWVMLVPGLAGIVLVGLGVRPVSQRFARRIVSAGLASQIVGVLLLGVYQRGEPVVLLAAAAAAIVAWDAAEHGISLGEQLRTDAETRDVELVHTGASGLYGAGLVLVGAVLWENAARGVPLGMLLLLLAAAVIAMAALYN